MGEAINLANNFKVEKVIFNCGGFNELEQELIQVLDKKKIPYYSCIKELNIDKNKLYFLNNKDYSNENDNSNVIYTELNNHKFLFMGDAGVKVEEDLIKKYNLNDIDVLKVGHHGSKTSSSREFINEIKEYTEKLYENIKHIDENGNEYWLARELQSVLEYTQWRRFENVINKAKLACNNSNISINDHFANVGKMVEIGSNTKRETSDYKLSRYACYLIAQNGDPRKEVIALAQTYFAIQTRKQELSKKYYNELTEDEKRLYRRNQARKGNFNLNKTAVNSGVKDLAKFHNAGYKGLYNGETADDIFKRKKLRYREDILDNICSEELANNIFRIAQTDAKLKRDNVDNEYTANSVHYEVGKEVRNSIKRLGGTMPENLPTPDKSLKELEKENKRLKD